MNEAKLNDSCGRSGFLSRAPHWSWSAGSTYFTIAEPGDRRGLAESPVSQGTARRPSRGRWALRDCAAQAGLLRAGILQCLIHQMLRMCMGRQAR